MICRNCKVDRSYRSFMKGRRTCTQCIVKNNYKNRSKWLASWLSYLCDVNPNPSCQVCGMKLTWQSGDRKTSVFLDHRRGGEPIKGAPYAWMRSRPCTDQHRLVFESCDFGILCNVCNLRLPTDNRKIWLQKAIKYAAI
jgi:hypothetical protein